MILTGRHVVERRILTNLRQLDLQVQPCGVDVSLKAVFEWKSSGVLDFSNALRSRANTSKLDFPEVGSLHLPLGSYLVEFNELLDVPLDIVGTMCSRSSLFRSGGLINGGLMDAGYTGVFGGLLQVINPYGLDLHRDARVAQAMFHQMDESVSQGYAGSYQNAIGMA